MRYFKKQIFATKGFTLVEIIIAVAVISALGAAGTYSFYNAVEKAKINKTIADYNKICEAAMAFHADTGTWPSDSNSFVENKNAWTGGTFAHWNGPYLAKFPRSNPWGDYYRYYNTKYTGLGTEWDWDIDGVPEESRFIEMYLVPLASAKKIERKLEGDGGLYSHASGIVQYPGGKKKTFVKILISRDNDTGLSPYLNEVE